MIKNVLTSIGGIENFGVISVCLFFVVFCGTLAWALLVKKSFAERMSAARRRRAQLENGRRLLP